MLTFCHGNGGFWTTNCHNHMAAAIVKMMFFAKNMTLDTFLLKKIHSFTPAFQKGNERKVHI